MTLSRRDLIATAAAGGAMLGAAAAAQTGPVPVQGDKGAPIIGPTNRPREAEDPQTISPPTTDHGNIPNLKWSFADSHMRLEEGGWARQTTTRELPVSKAMAGVNMRLKHYVVREMYWHKEAEWAFILKGRARITAIDQEGRTFADDVGEGDLWYFPSGIPHSIQGLPSVDTDGVEFLLVFDDGDFSEDSTFLLTDWLAHTPRDVIAKNLGVSEADLAPLPTKEKYIFPAAPPTPTLAGDTLRGNGRVPESFSHRMTAQTPIKLKGGEVQITDTRQFPASKTIAAALVNLELGALRELHWHPNGDEWQYYIEGKGRMTVFASESKARTFDYQAGDVGYVPRAMGHYIENTGTERLRFLEVFRAPLFQDVSLTQWLALTPHQHVQSHLGIDRALIDRLPTAKQLIVGCPPPFEKGTTHALFPYRVCCCDHVRRERRLRRDDPAPRGRLWRNLAGLWQ